ncbi:hypothetical protein BH09MYX1_BH09MYX1_45630 [soil metagenome]
MRLLFIAPFALAALAACSSDSSSGSGTSAFITWGEDYIENEIPGADFADGWTIKYDKFLVNFGTFKIADGTTVGAETPKAYLIDNHKPGRKALVAFPGLAAKNWTSVSYQIQPVNGDTTNIGASEPDFAEMKTKGLAIWVTATATKGAIVKTYDWQFTTKTLYTGCKCDVNGKEVDGTLVTNGGTDSMELTTHGDHFFYDDLQSPDAKRRFDNFAAADANTDGKVTLDELSAVKLITLDPKNGPYGTGGASGINDLGAFVTALSRTIGHFRGEGECQSKPL